MTATLTTMEVDADVDVGPTNKEVLRFIWYLLQILHDHPDCWACWYDYDDRHKILNRYRNIILGPYIDMDTLYAVRERLFDLMDPATRLAVMDEFDQTCITALVL
jgi:hypothetical protein